MNCDTEIKERCDDGRHRYEPSYRWVELVPGFRTATFRDSHLNVIVAFTRYTIFMSEEFQRTRKNKQAYTSAIESLVYALGSLSRYLASINVSWREIDDDILRGYANYADEEIKKSGKQKDELSSKRTVNVRLRQIYHALVWIQEDALMAKNLIGERNCQVRSSLVRIKNKGRDENSRTLEMFPQLFRRVGEGSRMHGNNYWATQDDFDNLQEYFWRRFEPDVAERNVVMLQIIDQIGFRRSSLASLNVSQFAGAFNSENPASGAQSYQVQPTKQKHSRTFTFQLDYALVASIDRFIKGARSNVVSKTDTKTDALFISSTTGQRLDLKTITKIFHEGMVEIGVSSPNAAAQAFRRKFGDDTHANAIASRKRSGLSVGQKEVAADVAVALGQNSYLSQQAYVKNSLRIQQESRETQLQRTIHAKDAEILQLNARIVRLEEL